MFVGLAVCGAAAGWPQSGVPRPSDAEPGAKYVGRKTCAACHAKQSAAQPGTPMGHALEPVADCRILRDHPKLTARLGPYLYEIVRQGPASLYTVSAGAERLTAPIVYAFGQGKAGQTYVLQIDGQYYESRVSYYREIDGLDLTMGASAQPASLVEAAGRLMHPDDVRDCFGCHATAAVSAGKAQLDRMTPGITCEGCHGPGARHVAGIQDGKPQSGSILNPAALTTEEMSDFCGACHRSWSTVTLLRIRGVLNVRFQPYRLVNSRCYDPADRRIRCAACHDPHENLQTGPAAYDSKCAACHSGAGQSPRRCPVGKDRCAGCHMPKIALPGAHHEFTDHQIRVVRAGAPYPN